MKKIGDLLKAQNLKKKLSQQQRKDGILKAGWKACTGEACCSHTNSLKVKNGVLTVFMDSQIWQQELLFRNRKKMAAEMQHETGFTIVDVKIKTGG